MSLRRKHPREQGDLGEASAIEWLTRQGATVWAPLFHSPNADPIAEWADGSFSRVQVKTSTYWTRERFSVSLKTCGGNQSWTGVVKRFDASRCDFLFVLVEDGRRWLIPAAAVEGTTAIYLGGPKYAEFEVDSALPL
jgi:PD-(D/E)XK nuclease superfamily protein